MYAVGNGTPCKRPVYAKKLEDALLVPKDPLLRFPHLSLEVPVAFSAATTDLLFTSLAPFTSCGVKFPCCAFPLVTSSLVKVVDVFATFGRSTYIPGFFGCCLPEYFAYFFAYFFDCIHCPDHVEVLIALDNLRVHDIDKWLATALEAAKKSTPIYKIV